MTPEEARARLAALGLPEPGAQVLFDHFDDAERRGKLGHGYARIPWLETPVDRPGGATREGRRPETASTAGTARVRSAI